MIEIVIAETTPLIPLEIKRKHAIKLIAAIISLGCIFMKISVILPYKNEEKSVGVCIEKIKTVLKGKDCEISILNLIRASYLSL